jgi:hypothetical protein
MSCDAQRAREAQVAVRRLSRLAKLQWHASPPAFAYHACIHRDCLGGSPPPTSAPGPGSPLPHLRRDQAHPAHICAGTRLTPPTSAPGLGSPRPHLRRDRALGAPAPCPQRVLLLASTVGYRYNICHAGGGAGMRTMMDALWGGVPSVTLPRHRAFQRAAARHAPRSRRAPLPPAPAS